MKKNRTGWNALLVQIALLVFMSVVSFTIFSLEAVGTVAYTVINLSVLLMGIGATVTAAKTIGAQA